MSPISNNINELKEQFDDLVQRNYKVQGEVNTAIRSEDYLKAVKIISNFVKDVDKFTKKTVTMAQNFRDKADDESMSVCNKIIKMAEHIKTAHLEVEENIIKKYRKKGPIDKVNKINFFGPHNSVNFILIYKKHPTDRFLLP